MGKFIIAYIWVPMDIYCKKYMRKQNALLSACQRAMWHMPRFGVMLFCFSLILFFFFFFTNANETRAREVWIPAVTLFGLIPEVSAPYTLLLTGRRRWRNMRTEPQDCLLFTVSDTEVKIYTTCHTVGTTESYWEYPCRVFPSKERGPAASAFLAESFHNILFHL